MRTVGGWIGALVVGIALALPTFIVPAVAQEAATVATPWQEVITHQIQAFRDHDAPAAFHDAGAGFQVTFPTPRHFFLAIISAGYAPIMDSVSHSFGDYQMLGETAVTQQVKLIGKQQERYDALYQLALEKDGWRVQGVQLMRQPGVGI